MRQRVLITGGLGFIGSNLAHAFHARGFQVSVYDASVPGSGANDFNLNGIKDHVELVHAPIEDSVKMAHAIKDKDIIINCAASTSHSSSMKVPSDDLETNARSVLLLLEAMRQQHSQARFIQIGTTTQLGRQPQGVMADENSPEHPVDIYSAHKSLAEKYTLIYAQYHGLDACVMRLPNVFGPRAAIASAALTFNNFFLGLALQGKDITVYGQGQQMRNIIYIDDVVRAIVMAATGPSLRSEVLMCVADEHLSVASIAKAIVQAVGRGQVTFKDWPQGANQLDVGDVCVSNAKIKRLLGWQPASTLATGLSPTIAYYQQHLSFYLR